MQMKDVKERVIRAIYFKYAGRYIGKVEQNEIRTMANDVLGDVMTLKNRLIDLGLPFNYGEQMDRWSTIFIGSHLEAIEKEMDFIKAKK